MVAQTALCLVLSLSKLRFVCVPSVPMRFHPCVWMRAAKVKTLGYDRSVPTGNAGKEEEDKKQESREKPEAQTVEEKDKHGADKLPEDKGPEEEGDREAGNSDGDDKDAKPKED